MIRHHLTQVLLGPHITSRAFKISEQANYTVFRVLPTATKKQIKLAVEAMFEVKVEAVKTLNVQGKNRRVGRKTGGRTKDWKKAYIKLAEGSSIDLLESAE